MLQTENELTGFFIVFFIILLSFITGTVLFIKQSRKKSIIHDKEKEEINAKHQLEIIGAQLASQTQTMQHIGTEIHDNVGQKLTLASLYSKQININNGNAEEKINAVSKIIDESLTDLRQLSKSLINPALAAADLTGLLAEDAKRINASGVCYVSIIASQAQIILPADKKNILYRLLQEFIQNSLKHAGCRKIIIDLKQHENILTVTASDDGKGFDAATVSKGIGLENMRRRAVQLSADFNLTSKEGVGTKLTLQLHL